MGHIIWDYLGPEQPLEPADVVIAGGSRDLYVAKEAAWLFKVCSARWLVVSGGWHEGLGGNEADAYNLEAIEHGVPPGAIIKDPSARNTGDHILFSERHFLGKAVLPKTVVLVHTPIMTRRFLATAEAQWQGRPQPRFISRHEGVDFDTYTARPGMEMVDTISRMLGYVARMHWHAKKGFQTPQEVPYTVQAACAELRARGYAVRGLHD